MARSVVNTQQNKNEMKTERKGKTSIQFACCRLFAFAQHFSSARVRETDRNVAIAYPRCDSFAGNPLRTS